MPLRPHPAAWIVAAAWVGVALVGLGALARPQGPIGPAVWVQRGMRERPPEVLLLGSSIVQADLDAPTISAHLGIDPGLVRAVVLTDSTVAHAYIALRNRVIAAGARPAWVILPTSLGQLLQAELDTPVDRIRYAAELLGDESDAELAPLGGQPGALRWRLRALGTFAEQGLLDGLRLQAFRAIGLEGGEATRALQQAPDVLYDVDEDALAASPGGLHQVLHELARFEAVDPVEATALGALADLCRREGVRLAVVRVPMPPFNSLTDLQSQEVADAAGRFVEARGGVWLDLREEPVTSEDFEDLLHMVPSRRVAFTRTVIARLGPHGFPAAR